MRYEWIAILIFVCVVLLILWRPRRINEAVPASLGALAVFALGYVSIQNVSTVIHIVSGAATITISTIIMSSILDKAGFFHWAALRIAFRAQGSGKRLFVYALLLSFLMTMFFNNDGSILITTPILLRLSRELKLTKKQSLPILLGSALIATSSSAPIGVSNIANLIALGIVGLNLNAYAELMFLPSMIGIATCGVLLFLVFRTSIPVRYELNRPGMRVFPPAPGEHIVLLKPGPHGPSGPNHVPPGNMPHPLPGPGGPVGWGHTKDLDVLMCKVGVSVVVIVRFGFFAAAALNYPPEWVAMLGAAFLMMVYASRHPQGAWPILRDAPWHIIVFAIGMYMLVYSLRNIGLIKLLSSVYHMTSGSTLLGSIIVTGILLSLMSCVMNNLPAVMIGTVMLTDLHLPQNVLQLSYLANVMGSDIGSLLLPMGTLASLLWFHIVSKEMRLTWKEYMRVSFIVIPPSLVVALLSLWAWGRMVAG